MHTHLRPCSKGRLTAVASTSPSPPPIATDDPQTGADHTASAAARAAAARQRRGSRAAAALQRTALALTIRKMAEEERKVVRRVPNKGQDDMVNNMVLPRAGALASCELDKEHHDGDEQGLRLGHCSFY
jgi:hypothetical protein